MEYSRRFYRICLNIVYRVVTKKVRDHPVFAVYCFFHCVFLLQFPVSAITWGHNDKRLFVATGNEIHIGWVSPTIGSLQLLSRLKIHNSLRNEDQVQLLPLPCRLQNLIGMLFTQTIRVCIVYEF